MSGMQDFMLSRVRVKLMQWFFTHPTEPFYVREISRMVKEEINAVRRELERMVGSSLLKSEERGNRVYYRLNPGYLYFQELQRMVAKSTGLGKKLRKFQRKMGDVQYAVFTSQFVEHAPSHPDRVDVLVIGEVVLAELEALIKEEQQERQQEINYAVFSIDEFEFRKSRRDPFITDFLFGSRIMVIGTESEFANRKQQL